MELREVLSSNIKKIGYENNELIVEYLSGAQYRYEEVPETVFNELLEAESKGRFMNSNIKGKYKFRKI